MTLYDLKASGLDSATLAPGRVLDIDISTCACFVLSLAIVRKKSGSIQYDLLFKRHAKLMMRVVQPPLADAPLIFPAGTAGP
eukprot:1607557-Pleurochrysis_carterae.AAC.1